MISSSEGRSETGKCEGGGGGESGMSGISETVDSSAKWLCSMTCVLSREFVTQTDKSG